MMKKIVSFDARCLRCQALRSYVVTQSDLGRLDIALTVWCECPTGDLVESLESQRPSNHE